MKQHITKEQWDEIPRELLRDLYNIIEDNFGFIGGEAYKYCNIGIMIEFLWEDLVNINRTLIGCNITSIDKRFESKELADALWEAVKEKLNETNNI